MRPRGSLGIGLLALAALVAAAPVRADEAAADAAFEAGDNAKALALYDEVLASSPRDVHALLRSGMLLSWDRKYDEALARYAKALSIEPGNTRVELERAKVLLWSKRYDEARPAFRGVLQDDPKEIWALTGLAQSYAWTGKQAEAIPWYEKALAVDPTMKEARLGLAYAHLETGDPSKAAHEADALAKDYPDDKEVADLGAAVRRARAPWVAIGFDHIDDSEDNGMTTWRLEGGLPLPARLDLRLGVTRTGLGGIVPPPPMQPDFPATASASGTAESLYGVLGWQPAPRQRGELRVGVARLTDSVDDTRTTGIGGVSYAFPMASWDGRASVERDPLLYSPWILDYRVDVTTLAFHAEGQAAPRVRVETNAAYGDYSDDNTRIYADGGAWYAWHPAKHTLEAGGVLRYYDFSKETGHGYFDPSNYVSAVASFRARGPIDGSKWRYGATVEAGSQWYTYQGVSASGRFLASAYGEVSRPLPHGLSLSMYAGWSNASAAAGPGFHSIAYGARLRWSIGG